MSKPQWTTNLGLPESPQTKDPLLYIELLRIYNAVRNLAYKIDAIAGLTPYDDSEKIALVPANTLLLGNQSYIYVKMAVAISAGQTVDFQADGTAILGTTNTVKGVALEDKEADEYCKILLIGYLPLGGTTPGTVYYASESVSGGFATTGTQVLGYGLPGGGIMFSPI